MRAQKKRGVAPTTTPSKQSIAVYIPLTRWSNSINLLLGTLLLASQSKMLPDLERQGSMKKAVELIRLKADLGLIGEGHHHA